MSSTRHPKSPSSQRYGGRNQRGGKPRDSRSAQTQPSLPRVRERVADRPEGVPALILKEGRERSLQRRHPWIFSGAVEHVEGAPASGDTVAVCDAAGGLLAWAAYNPQSQMVARVWSFEASETIAANFFRRRIERALATRRDLGFLPSPASGRGAGGEGEQNTGCRLIHGESDGLPGLIVDRYGEVVVMQLGSAGTERWREAIADALWDLCQPVCLYERSDSDGRELEGLPARSGVVRGALPEAVEVVEHGLRFAVDVADGQKTGFFLDQRDNRRLTGELARDRDVLNCFCYTGGFSLYALRGGAKSVLSIDISADAVAAAERNVALNDLDSSQAEWQCADVFAALRKLRDQNRKFDLVILDPPKFAPTAAFAEKAARGYKDINLLGFKLLRPGGLLFTYSCSGGISEDLFQKIIAGAALDAGVEAQIVHRLHASADHPVVLSFPEGAYLKGLVLRVA
ncbi:class I SAM-dependent rRNA methyltransferase [Ferriphaselus sp. R-1]|uniref:class I SAM-dependent rRNA methyltransferase n=1 Tax=Ferriphaselus sp. R-1 TaxID=1485544 RepID=UPI0009DEDA37|nr:class I SAM-dependent rRNA methyltransferase [Ferriphaselus sp. R-1]